VCRSSQAPQWSRETADQRRRHESLVVFKAVCDAGPSYPLFTPAAVAGSPVRTEFIGLGSITLATTEPCDVALLAVADGQSTVPLLRPGEVALQQGPGAIRSFGWGDALAVLVSTELAVATPAVPHLLGCSDSRDS
jgi:hypothetical protein